MDKECQKRIAHITSGFHTCKTAFTAIGDETRQVILLILIQSERSGIRVNEIAERAHLTSPSVSHHLQILKEAGIVDMRKEGTKNYYYISADNTQWKQVKQLIDLIYDSVIHLQKEEEERHL